MGFFDCPPINPLAIKNTNIARLQPVNRLQKIRYFYDHFLQLGINTIYFGPLFESCTHGYDTVDYFQIDRRLGNNKLFKEIISELHTLGIKVILDGVFNHTSRLFFAFSHLRKHQKKSQFINWFEQIDFTKNTVWNDGFFYQNWENHTELPQLNLVNPDVQKYILKIIQYWQKEFCIDGWRLDVAYNLPIEFIRKIKILSRDINPDSFIFGELIHENYKDFIDNNLLDSATNYQLYHKIIQSLNQQDIWQLNDEIRRQQEKYQNIKLINFTGNHDTSRIFSLLHNKNNVSQIFNYIFTIPNSIPCIYYGDEIGLDGEKLSRYDSYVRQPMPYPKNFSNRQKKYLEKIIPLLPKQSP